MPTICQLSPSVVNKIAAGEVIERPASVVKELVENAVDAGARRVDVAIEKGGSELVRVADDGCGVAADELPLAVASHATSKIRSADDLFSIGSLGFRGEALASIAEVSRFTIRSRPADALSGAELEVVGGQVRPVVPVGCPVGTTIEVRNLFFNTPVRHKFLRTAQTEMGHATEAVVRLALAHPQVHFTLTHGGRSVHDLPPTGDLRGRVAAFFGEELADALIEVDSESDGVRLSGYVANPQHSRSHTRMQYLLLNGRPIRDRALQHALGEAYRGLLLTGRQPICFLRLEMPAELVDVNVHPTKAEVRFQDAGRLYSQLLGTLRTKFLTTDLAARGRSPATPHAPTDREAAESTAGPSQLVAWAKEQLGRQAGQGGAAERAGSSSSPAGAEDGPARLEGYAPARWETRAQPRSDEPLRLHRVDPPEFRPFGKERGTRSEAPVEHCAESDEYRDVGQRRALQVHDRYLVVETPQGLEIIDQHALHERILYEQIRERVLAGAIESQRLLVPEPVDLAPAEAAAVLQERELLERLGIEVQPFGGETVLVASYPAMLAKLSPAAVLREVVERLLAGGQQPEPRDLLDELLHMIACKAAVKFGDHLTGEEIDALLALRHLAQDSHHCPHGRPTSLVFTREELDRQFKRV